MPSAELAGAVAALPPPWRGHFFAAVESTQDLATDAAKRGAPSRSIYVADYQRAGRGRQGRSWLAAPGSALMLSIVFREGTAAPVPWRWTSLASVSLAEAIEAVLPGLHPTIKWPNDVLLDGRKVAGILAESTWDGRALVVVVGIGVNVHDHPPLGPHGLPTSLAEGMREKEIEGCTLDRGQLLEALVARLDAWLARPPADLVPVWQARLWGRGQRVRLVDVNGEEEVVVLGAGDDGALRVRRPDGTERSTTTAELIL